MRELTDLPKAHLHVHLEGAMRPSTLRDFAVANGEPVPATRGYASFAEFLVCYEQARQQIRSWAQLRRVVRELVEDDAAAGAVWVEPHFDPSAYPVLGSPDEVLEAVLDEGARTGERLGIGFGLVISATRHLGVTDAGVKAALAARWAGRGVVAFGLAGDEGPFPPEPFVTAFAIAREAGLRCVPHAGELAGPDSVRGALDVLGADRIEHGVRAVEDPALVERLAADGVTLDVCPTSNLMLSVVPSLDAHPLRALLEAGVRCTLNADDPLLFGPGLLAEYELARGGLALDDAQLARLARCSIEASGAPPELARAALGGVDGWLNATGEQVLAR